MDAPLPRAARRACSTGTTTTHATCRGAGRPPRPWSVMVSEFMLQQTPVGPRAAGARRLAGALADAGRPGRGPHRRGGADVGPARLPAPRPAPARRSRRDRASATTARCRRRTTTCSRCPASGTTPRRRSPASPSASATSCSTPTSAGCWRAPSPAREFPAPAVTRAERDVATALLPDDAATAATWAVATMELGALVCTARQPSCDACPVAEPVRLARRRLPGVRRTAPSRAGLGRHRPPVPRPHHGARARRRVARSAQPRSRPAWPEREQRERCLAGLVDDGLLTQITPGRWALPG